MLLEKLERADGFSDAERKIAAYILKRRENVLGLTIRELAADTYSSNPTIVRLCRKIGVGGFREFKIVLSSELERAAGVEKVDANIPFDGREEARAIAERIAGLTRSTVRDAYSLLDGAALDAAASAIGEARQVYLFAVGDSMIRAMSFQGKLLKIGRPVQISNFLQEQGYHASNAAEGDCALFITYHARQPEYLRYAETMRERGVRLIAVTADARGELAQRCGIVLPLPLDEEPAGKIATFSSQIAIDYVLNVLYSCVFNLRYEHHFRIKQDNQDYVERITRS
ncbi:MurR/RpiR family transcriptional regulator [Saccharibacillus sp. CPCC 101409]|uniref:MurR/RpiR family transcriptional regulator n=1 Tax=Saccharibacillus sp. CPCC 101409 TaxID=3058041 RepID=UPI0026725295|nr:MurR/RpiR family transcriptional regulator [Saccharibacillus sp. CPCC 101409]MDO3408903.1 MurR/RpiR family transcriptional regulator [Saccharibacillus sp. CPCC 101409]